MLISSEQPFLITKNMTVLTSQGMPTAGLLPPRRSALALTSAWKVLPLILHLAQSPTSVKCEFKISEETSSDGYLKVQSSRMW